MTVDREPIVIDDSIFARPVVIDDSIFARPQEPKTEQTSGSKRNGLKGPWSRNVRIGERPARLNVDENGIPSVTILPNYYAYPKGIEKNIKDFYNVVYAGILPVTNPEALAPTTKPIEPQESRE